MAKGVKGSSPKEADKPKRTSFNILPLTKRKLDFVAYHEQKDLTSIVDEALNDFIRKYEKKNGPIQVK